MCGIVLCYGLCLSSKLFFLQFAWLVIFPLWYPPIAIIFIGEQKTDVPTRYVIPTLNNLISKLINLI